MGRPVCLSCDCGNGVCRHVQLGQLPNLDVLLGPVTAPPPPEPVFRAEVTAPYPSGTPDWVWLALGAMAVVVVTRR